MSSIRVKCPGCQARDEVDPSRVFPVFHCPQCGKEYAASSPVVDNGSPALEIPGAFSSANQSSEAEPLLSVLPADDGDDVEPITSKRCPVCGQKALPLQTRCLHCNSILDPTPADGLAVQALVTPKNCPGCQKPLKPGAVLCIECGFDLRKGYRRNTIHMGTIDRDRQYGRNRPPVLVEVYGWLYMAVFGGLGVLNLIVHFVNLVAHPEAFLFILFSGILTLALCVVLFRLGGGLMTGERSAVYGTFVLWVLATLAGVIMLVAHQASIVPGAIALGVSAAVFLPPIVIAFFNWDEFH